MDTTNDATNHCFGNHDVVDPVYTDYHDTEWGRPVRSEAGLFERICLEGFQVGLSWSTVLHKRDAFREVFEGFDPEKVAAFSDHDIERLLGDQRIIRNRAKTVSCINGARIVVAMHNEGQTLAELIWGFQPANHTRPEDAGSRPKTSPEAHALAEELHGQGFRFVGPVNMYATMQACGLVNDHILGCAVGDAIDAL